MGLFSKKKQTIGYAYFMGLHMVIAKSADALLVIRAADRNLFSGGRSFSYYAANGHFRNPYNSYGQVGWYEGGDVGAPVIQNEQIHIYKPDAFGGKEREGGIMGALDVMFGGPTQTANDYLESVLGAPQPAYRGTFGVIFRGGMVGAMNPYLKPWEFRIRRNLKGWQGGTAWYASACEIDVGQGVKCMNPAHIIYQVLTDAEDGMGYPSATLDDASFRAAADLYKSEGLGLFMKWTQSDKIEAFIQQVADHCNAFVIQNPTNGLFQIRSMRGGYSLEPLLTLTPDNSTLEMFERSTLEETVNEITVKWDDTFTRSDGSITIQSLANIQAMGGVINQTKTYGGCPTEAIAKRLAQRDLDISSALLARVRIKATRVAAGLVPGDVIKVQGFTKIGLQLIVVRILRVVYGGPDNQEVTIDGAEDVFGLPLNSYVGTQPSGWTPPQTTPVASPNVDAYEVPFRDIAEGAGAAATAALAQTSGFLGFSAQKPTNLPINFTLTTRRGADAYIEADTGEFTPTALLTSAIGKTDTVLPIGTTSNMQGVDVGNAAFIGEHPGAEVVGITAITGNTITVARGALDTTPEEWPAGTRIWVYDGGTAVDPIEYSAGQVVDAKALTITSTGTLEESAAATETLTFNSRSARPYPPAKLRINGAAWPTTSWARLVITWNHRDRIAQAEAVVGTDAASVGPEAGTTYTVRIYSNPSTLLHTETGITGNTFTYDVAASAEIRVEVEAKRGTLTSWQIQKHAVSVNAAGLVTNGTLASDTAWDKGTGWTIAGGKASKAAGTASSLGQAIALVSGASYLAEFTVAGRTAGTARLRFTGGSTVSAPAATDNGTFVSTLTANSGSNKLEVYADAAFDGSVDNIKLTRLT